MLTKFAVMKPKVSLVILLTFVAVLIFAGCKKSQKDNLTNVKQPTISNINVVPLIKSFKLRMNSNLKSTDCIPADSAEWYLAAMVNYTYCDASVKGEYQFIDSTFISLPKQGKNVSIASMDTMYNAIIDSLRNQFNSINNSEKYLLAVYIKNIQQSSSQIDFKIVTFIEYGPVSNAYLTFGINDDWKWWNMGMNNGGYCDGLYQGTDLASDAAIQLTNKVMLRRSVPSEGYCFISPFSDITLYADHYINPNHGSSYNYQYYYMYQNTTQYPDYNTCLSYIDMNFYLLGAETIVYTADVNGGAEPPDQSFVSISLFGDLMAPTNYTIYLHRGDAYYGILIRGGNQDHL
jgi:hypothetical protein